MRVSGGLHIHLGDPRGLSEVVVADQTECSQVGGGETLSVQKKILGQTFSTNHEDKLENLPCSRLNINLTNDR